MSDIRAIILGCGSSGGVPRVGNDWGVCDPDNPKNRRSRCSLYLEITDSSGVQRNIIIDTAPDLREQLLKNDISQVDSVLFTHTHADQCHGIDDLRVLAYIQRKRVPVFASEESFRELYERFRYCFETPSGTSYPPILDAQPAIQPNVRFRLESSLSDAFDILPLDQDHGPIRSLGFRIGNLAYCNDVVELPENSLNQLEGLDVLIVDALRYEPHPTHAHLAKSLSWIERLKPRQAILTNMHIDLDYETLKRELPAGVLPAYDGLTLNSYFP